MYTYLSWQPSPREHAPIPAKRLKEDEIQQMNLFGDAKSTVNGFSMAKSEDYSMEESGLLEMD